MHLRSSFRLFLSLLVLTIAQQPSSAQALGTIRHVKPGGLKSGTCSTWAKACDLQYAMEVSVAHDQIWVKAGTYKPGAFRTDSFFLNPDVAVYGGFAGGETKLGQRDYKHNVTILSGAIGTSSFDDNSYHVVTGDGTSSTARLDGFTITGGNADGDAPYHVGGGIYNDGGSPLLFHLIIKGNKAPGPSVGAGCGGGMFNGNGGSPHVSYVTFKNNTSVGGCGGGMYNYSNSWPLLFHVSFVGNSASNGGGMYDYQNSDASLTNVTFSTNKASVKGGGMYSDNSGGSLMNVTFTGNKALFGDGGGMYILAEAPSIHRVKFVKNSAQNGGGMMVVSGVDDMADVTFQGNTATQDGGGLYHHGGALSPLGLNAVTFSANKADGNGGGLFETGGTATLRNATFSGNTAVNGGGAAADAGVLYGINLTLAGNSVTGSAPSMYGGDGIYLANSIVWGGALPLGGAASYHFWDDVISGGCPSAPACTHVVAGNPHLGTLANNGGFTKTIAIQAGSSALNTGGQNAGCEPKDQRGVTRPQGSACDMGAYEKK